MSSDQAVRHCCAAPAGANDPATWAHGAAVTESQEDEGGAMFVGNGEYATRVNFCPFCGVKATLPIPEPATSEV